MEEEWNSTVRKGIVCFQDTGSSEANDLECNGSILLTDKTLDGIVAAVCKSPNHRREQYDWMSLHLL